MIPITWTEGRCEALPPKIDEQKSNEQNQILKNNAPTKPLEKPAYSNRTVSQSYGRSSAAAYFTASASKTGSASATASAATSITKGATGTYSIARTGTFSKAYPSATGALSSTSAAYPIASSKPGANAGSQYSGASFSVSSLSMLVTIQIIVSVMYYAL